MFSRFFAIIGLMTTAIFWVLYVGDVVGVMRIWDDPFVGVLATGPLLALVLLATYIAVRPD